MLASAPAPRAQEAEPPDPAEVQIGERLFLETRFAQFFAKNAADVNAPLVAGDPVVETTETLEAPLPGPFAGRSMNCRACHLVDEQLETPAGGMRTYADFARRTPVPAREDGKTTTPRNSPPLVNASLARPGGLLLHFDGEFPSLEDLVVGTLTGRNYGWLPGEANLAVAHVARVIRADDGTGELAQEFGGSYARVLAGTHPSLPEELRLPSRFRIDVAHASDAEIVDAVARLIAAYVEQLVFETGEDGAFVGSPFDRFLELNQLPRVPKRGESAAAFSARLRRALEALRAPVFVEEGPFAFHEQERNFGALELEGLRIFLTEAPAHDLDKRELARAGLGNCTACHPAPAFSDFRFHNTGVSQVGYDKVHGAGRFAELFVPKLRERNRHPELWLPATEQHPDAVAPFRASVTSGHPELADLGVWNVFANPDFPRPQARLREALCAPRRVGCREDRLLDRALGALEKPELCDLLHSGPYFHEGGDDTLEDVIELYRDVARGCPKDRLLRRALAAFKTPGLRDLSHSGPYFHDGGFDALEDVIGLYRDVSDLARAGRLRNADPEIARIALAPDDVEPLAAFLRSLNEDYE